MKSTKNNTCIRCGKHIDKSDCGDNWMTIIKSSYWNSENKQRKGYRVTLCPLCFGDINSLVLQYPIEKLEKENEVTK